MAAEQYKIPEGRGPLALMADMGRPSESQRPVALRLPEGGIALVHKATEAPREVSWIKDVLEQSLHVIRYLSLGAQQATTLLNVERLIKNSKQGEAEIVIPAESEEFEKMLMDELVKLRKLLKFVCRPGNMVKLFMAGSLVDIAAPLPTPPGPPSLVGQIGALAATGITWVKYLLEIRRINEFLISLIMGEIKLKTEVDTTLEEIQIVLLEKGAKKAASEGGPLDLYDGEKNDRFVLETINIARFLRAIEQDAEYPDLKKRLRDLIAKWIKRITPESLGKLSS
jgi:hypothetical protein